MLDRRGKKGNCIRFTVITTVSVGLYENTSVIMTEGGVRAQIHKVFLIWFA